MMREAEGYGGRKQTVYLDGGVVADALLDWSERVRAGGVVNNTALSMVTDEVGNDLLLTIQVEPWKRG